ncbi:type II secretion system F family protein [Campylobacterota bacterium DY0563]
MNLFIVLLIIIIPLLLIITTVLVYNFFIQFNKQKLIVNKLSKDNNRILDEKKKSSIFSNENKNWLEKKLAYAGFTSPIAQVAFIIICIIFGFLAGTFVNFVITNPVIFIVSWIMFSFFPLLILKKLIDYRLEEFNFGLKVVIDKVTSMMKSGVGFEQALKKSVITSKSKLTKDILSIYLTEKDVIGEKKAFEKMFHLINSKELRIFYLTISIGRQSGGKFSNTLEKLRKTLHDQGEIKQEITSSTREVKIGSYLIIGIIVFIYIMMNSSMDGVLDEHFFGTSEGQIQLFFISVWVAFGLFVNSMLTKVK